MITLEEIHGAKKTSFVDVIKSADPDGLFMEFGVHTGGTIRQIAQNTSQHVYGFDSFEGLPESWNGLSAGHFACSMPTDMPENVSFVKGLFQDTLPSFVKEHTDKKVSFVHFDCDLYSSTKCIFDNIFDILKNGTVIAFYELFGYKTYEHHEFKAFNEFLEKHNYSYECLGTYGPHQVAFKIFK